LSGNVTGNLTGNVTGSISGGTLSGSTCSLSSTININTGSATGGDALILQNGGDFRIYNGGNAGSVNLYCDTNALLNITGGISCTGDVTALTSDMRLKTDIKPLQNALDKICGLSAFTYKFNNIATEFGLPSEDQVGVSAQEIQEVLPEAVKSAPFDTAYDEDGNPYSKSGENYLTVQYEKLVPLLIEAIKELSDRLEKLENKK